MQVGIPLYIRTGKFETDRNPKKNTMLPLRMEPQENTV